MNTIGLIDFALVGSAKAIREEFAQLEPIIVGLTMAFAGGVTRNLLVTRIPLVLQSLIEISLGLLGVSLAIALSVVVKTPETHPVTFIADAIALAAFATTGAIVATEAGVSAFGIVAIATINAIGGGTVADILLDRPPFILFEEFYASCAILGGTAYWIATMFGRGGYRSCGVCVGDRRDSASYGIVRQRTSDSPSVGAPDRLRTVLAKVVRPNLDG
jgi:uncharacterized membrane protein YeiH